VTKKKQADREEESETSAKKRSARLRVNLERNEEGADDADEEEEDHLGMPDDVESLKFDDSDDDDEEEHFDDDTSDEDYSEKGTKKQRYGNRRKKTATKTPKVTKTPKTPMTPVPQILRHPPRSARLRAKFGMGDEDSKDSLASNHDDDKHSTSSHSTTKSEKSRRGRGKSRKAVNAAGDASNAECDSNAAEDQSSKKSQHPVKQLVSQESHDLDSDTSNARSETSTQRGRGRRSKKQGKDKKSGKAETGKPHEEDHSALADSAEDEAEKEAFAGRGKKSLQTRNLCTWMLKKLKGEEKKWMLTALKNPLKQKQTMTNQKRMNKVIAQWKHPRTRQKTLQDLIKLRTSLTPASLKMPTTLTRPKLRLWRLRLAQLRRIRKREAKLKKKNQLEIKCRRWKLLKETVEQRMK